MLAADYWTFTSGEALQKAKEAMQHARRMAYLALLAYEYETQQTTTDYRNTILSTKNPNELVTLSQELRASLIVQATGFPSNDSLPKTVSLRKHVFQLRDGDTEISARGMTPKELFRNLIMDGRYADFNEAGTYLGQRIPFSIMPDTGWYLAGGPNSEVAGPFTKSYCAERIWGLHVNLVGDRVLKAPGTPENKDILVRKYHQFGRALAFPKALQAFLPSNPKRFQHVWA